MKRFFWLFKYWRGICDINELQNFSHALLSRIKIYKMLVCLRILIKNNYIMYGKDGGLQLSTVTVRSTIHTLCSDKRVDFNIYEVNFDDTLPVTPHPKTAE